MFVKSSEKQPTRTQKKAARREMNVFARLERKNFSEAEFSALCAIRRDGGSAESVREVASELAYLKKVKAGQTPLADDADAILRDVPLRRKTNFEFYFDDDPLPNN